MARSSCIGRWDLNSKLTWTITGDWCHGCFGWQPYPCVAHGRRKGGVATGTSFLLVLQRHSNRDPLFQELLVKACSDALASSRRPKITASDPNNPIASGDFLVFSSFVRLYPVIRLRAIDLFLVLSQHCLTSPTPTSSNLRGAPKRHRHSP